MSNPVGPQNTMQIRPEATAYRAMWLKVFPCQLLMLAALYVFPLDTLNAPGLFVMVLAVSWCLYHYFLPLHLIRRRALLEHLTSQHSVLRRWLWKGLWSRFLLLLWCVVLAVSVLLLSYHFSATEWLILLLCVPLFLMLIPLALRWSGSEAEQYVHYPLALRIAVYLIIVISTFGLIAVQMLGDGVPDTRQLSLIQVVAQSWSTAVSSTSFSVIGWMSGLSAVMNNSVWHLMQQASTLSEQSAALKLAAWLFFLLFITLRAALIWFVLAGLLSWLSGVARRSDRLSGQANAGVHFASGISLLVIISLLLAQPGVSVFVSRLADQSMQALPIPMPDPCARLAPLELAESEQRSRNAISNAHLLWQQDTDRHLDAAFERAFAHLEPAVDSYLDWNFSIGGQYLQLGFLMSAILEKNVEQRFADYISTRIDEHISPVLSPALLQVREELLQQFDSEAQAFYVQQAMYLDGVMTSTHCLESILPPLTMPELTSKSAVGVGPLMGLLVSRFAVHGGANVGSKVLTRNASKRIISASAAKVSAKATESSGAAGFGLGCGVMAPVCVPVLFVATWLGTDLLINKVDEAINRPQMKADLMSALQEEKQRLQAEYKDLLASATSQWVTEVNNYHDQRFRILRDGI